MEIKYDCEIEMVLSDVFMILRKPLLMLPHRGQFQQNVNSVEAPKNAALRTSSRQDVLR